MYKHSLAVLGLSLAAFASAAAAEDRFADQYRSDAYAKVYYGFEFGGSSAAPDQHRVGFLANAVGNERALPMMEYRQSVDGHSSLSLSGMPIMADGQYLLNANGDDKVFGMDRQVAAVVFGAAIVTAVIIIGSDDDDDSSPPATGGN